MCYALIGVLRNSKKLSEPFANHEFRDAIQHPLGIISILKFHKYKIINLSFWLIGKIPPALTVKAITLIAKKKGLL